MLSLMVNKVLLFLKEINVNINQTPSSEINNDSTLFKDSDIWILFGDLNFRVDMEYEDARNTVQDFINARYREEIIFTSGATQSLNMIAQGFFANF